MSKKKKSKKNKVKMPKHWKKVKKAFNEAMKVEMELSEDDDRDCIYFSLDSSLAHLLSYLLYEFSEYMSHYTESWGDMGYEATYQCVYDMARFFTEYKDNKFDDKWKTPEEYEAFKKETFGKFYEYFEHLWT